MHLIFLFELRLLSTAAEARLTRFFIFIIGASVLKLSTDFFTRYYPVRFVRSFVVLSDVGEDGSNRLAPFFVLVVSRRLYLKLGILF